MSDERPSQQNQRNTNKFGKSEGRVPNKDITPVLRGWDYEPGCSLVANAYLVHHDPDLYPDPYTFRPERFLGEKPGTYTWIPFGGGRRRCLGSSFAMLEVKIVLAEILRRYEIRPATGKPELARRRNITVRPGDGARVALRDREHAVVAA